MPIKCMNGLCSYWDNERLDFCSSPLVGITDCKNADVVDVWPQKKVSGSDTSFHQAVKRSNECACESDKKEGHLFCFNCYITLPQEMRDALYVGSQAEKQAAYEGAHLYLVESERI